MSIITKNHKKKNYHRNTETKNLPFRPCVGMFIINRYGNVFLGKNTDNKGWQMPQGGIDFGETPYEAVFREMQEEIGCNKCNILQESSKYYTYRIPDALIEKFWNGKYCGQKQKWFLMKFTGKDSDIDLNVSHPEFEEWQWVLYDDLLNQVVPFKRFLYSKLMEEFKDTIKNHFYKS